MANEILPISFDNKMTQLKSYSLPSNSQNSQKDEDLGNQILQEQIALQHKSDSIFKNFLREVKTKTIEVYYSIIGNYDYKPKNSFSYLQKQKILDYLRSKILTDNNRLKEMEKVKFTDFDPKYLDLLPENIEALRSRILKARAHLEAVESSLQKIAHSRDEMTIRYLNEQAFEYDQTKYNSMAWGFVFGSILNCTVFKKMNSIRKIAVFLAMGHCFGAYSYAKNLDRYFDSVYPIFERDATKFSLQQKEIYSEWKPQWGSQIDE